VAATAEWPGAVSGMKFRSDPQPLFPQALVDAALSVQAGYSAGRLRISLLRRAAASPARVSQEGDQRLALS
jgi:hypothetical protein